MVGVVEMQGRAGGPADQHVETPKHASFSGATSTGQVVIHVTGFQDGSLMAVCEGGQAVRNVAAVLRPGQGRVYVRDYARGDLAQHRLSSTPRPQQLAEDFYLRMDGTRAYYFTEAGAQIGSLRALTPRLCLTCNAPLGALHSCLGGGQTHVHRPVSPPRLSLLSILLSTHCG